ncbi:MAG TPA: ABC transporter permease [Puia sp.]|jgi:putative ABC transport system permease protein|nr:ABC transporter permease [Puia sp.]
MLKNYFKIALRNLRKSKMYSFINITGLSAGIAVSILLLLWVDDELSFDRFNVNAKDLYTMMPKFENGSDPTIWNTTPAPVAIYAKKEVPGVEDACRVTENWAVSVFEYNGKKLSEWHNCLADSSFFSMFTYPIIKGNPKRPFLDAHSIVLSESTAKAFFGGEDPIGKVMKGDDKKIYQVTGVMKDMPANSSIKFNIVFNFQILEKENDTTGFYKSLPIDANWGQYNYETYVQLKPGASPVAAGKELAVIHRRAQHSDFTKHLVYQLNPLTKLHLYAPDGKEQGMMIVRVFFIVAVIVLLIACINYVNLITARAIKRSKEISLRKIVGAGKSELFLQFLSESLLTFLIALVLATGLIYGVMPVYNGIAGKDIVFRPWEPQVLAVYGLTLLATLLLAGIYPAITLSSFRPLEAMKGKLSGIGSKGNFRKVLVVVQFSFSIMLITSTIIIGRQLKFIREKNLGYDKANVFSIWMRNIDSHYEAVKAELLQQPGILGVTESGIDIINSGTGTSDASWDGKRPDQQTFTIGQMPVERNFLEVMGMQLAEGKGFTGSPADSSNFILNETAIKATGIQEPAVGKRFTFHGTKGVIAGVVKDFHFQNMHTAIRPLLIQYDKYWRGKMYVRTTGRDAARALAAVESIWKRYNADYDFSYTFLDTAFDDLYKTDMHVGLLFNCFAVLAIVISCLGLFGLVTYTAETRVKEIGVRKVLGAGVPHIVSLLSRQFLVLVVVAAAIAFPVAWYGLKGFLQGYAYRTDLSWWVFAVAGALTLLIALLTVSFRCIQAALANPVAALRSE